MWCFALEEEGQSEEEEEEKDIHREGEHGPDGLFVEKGREA